MPVGIASGFVALKFAHPVRSLRRLRAALLFGIMAVGFGASVPSVSASCGDYVVIGSPSAAAQSHDAAAMPAAEVPQHAEQGPLAPVPCHGPSCRRVPHPFAVPNVPPPGLERSQDCWSKLSDEACEHEATAMRLRGEFDAPPLSAVWYPATWRPPEAI